MANRERRTEDEIKAMAAALQRARDSLPPRSVFGDPNWKIIDAQLTVLHGQHQSVDGIYDAFEYTLGRDNISPVLAVLEWLEGYDNAEDVVDEEYLT